MAHMVKVMEFKWKLCCKRSVRIVFINAETAW